MSDEMIQPFVPMEERIGYAHQMLKDEKKTLEQEYIALRDKVIFREEELAKFRDDRDGTRKKLDDIETALKIFENAISQKAESSE